MDISWGNDNDKLSRDFFSDEFSEKIDLGWVNKIFMDLCQCATNLGADNGMNNAVIQNVKDEDRSDTVLLKSKKAFIEVKIIKVSYA